ncbi:U-box domain-containing protein 15-like [Impatiens glandulifera]|uniref:U-box domain-containing protein 15-like n=1 Tax=Impatiens glandulifera TaxID=253017 RepID=UPI001FB08465|nr:U-box domain-containing protein 15-like [Impatiens glandulifera]
MEGQVQLLPRIQPFAKQKLERAGRMLLPATASSDHGSSCTGTGLELTGGNIVAEMLEAIDTVTSFTSYRRTHRKDCLNLSRRLKLLIPFLEEIRDYIHVSSTEVSNHAIHRLMSLKKALVSAKKLLKICNHGSKIYLALESEAIMSRFHSAYDKLNDALDNLPCEELGTSEEVKEQVELMRVQLKRAKRRADTQDIELAMDMMVVFSKGEEDRSADMAILERLAKKLELHTIPDLKIETALVDKLVNDRGHSSETIKIMLDVLWKFKQIAGVEVPEDVIVNSPVPTSRSLRRCRSFLYPNEFLCPITLDLMTDPVIIATGQTYERESIERWLSSDQRTCPKTGQKLTHLTLVPNFALRNLILQWCETNSIELLKKYNLDGSDSFAELTNLISSSIQNLSSHDLDTQMEAIAKIRMLSKDSPEGRTMIANNGGIPPLVHLLSRHDPRIQEHAVTALLNLSLDESNKRVISREGAIPFMIDILHNGTNEGKENSAAALFSLSMLDENKVLIGSINGIPALVKLLSSGTIRGKKDAATALFNLSLNVGNKCRAIKAGIVSALVELMEDKESGMMNESLSILLLLASNSEGCKEMGQLSFVKTIVSVMRDGTEKNKECATALLLELSLKNSFCILAALHHGVYEPLVEIAKSGTNRGKRKANSLLQHMSNCEQIP